METRIESSREAILDVKEPVWLEVFITVQVGNLFRSAFRKYVDRLPIRGSERILELGPSAGNTTRELARRLEKGGGSVTAVDISQVWIKVARKRLRKLPNVALLCGDIAALNLAEASYDAALLSFVLHEIPAGERPRILKHLVAKLGPGGKLFIREPLSFISQAEIRGLLEAQGLQEISSALTTIKTQGQVFEAVFSRGA